MRTSSPGSAEEAAARAARDAQAKAKEAEAKATAEAKAAAFGVKQGPTSGAKGGRRGSKKGGAAVSMSGWAVALLLAARQLDTVGWVRLPDVCSDAALANVAEQEELPTLTMAGMLEAIREPSHPWEGIFNGERPNAPQTAYTRFHGAAETWRPLMTAFITSALDQNGLLHCKDGRAKHVNTCKALRSNATCATAEGEGSRSGGGLGEGQPQGRAARRRAAGTAASATISDVQPGVPVTEEAAALMGRQPLHSDAPKPTRGTLAGLRDGDAPLSVMVALEPATKLWIFPSGCDHPEDALLVHLNVGDMLVWRGDLVHAGAGTHAMPKAHPPPPHTRPSPPCANAGYHVEHIRVHAYVDPPPDIYRRPHGATDVCQPRGLFHQPAASVEATAARASAATARGTTARAATVAAARRAAATPSDVGTIARSSPSIHPDEMSDGWNSDDEAEFYTSPRADGISDSHSGAALFSGGSEDAAYGVDAAAADDGEAELGARLEADDASHVPFVCPSCEFHLTIASEQLLDAATCVRCPKCAAVFDVEPDGTVHSDGLPTADERPISAAPLAKPADLLRKDLVWTPWPDDTLFISLSIITTGGSAPRVLSIAAEVVDPYALLRAEAPGTTGTNYFQQYVQLPDHYPVDATALQATHGLDLEAMRAEATSDFRGVASNFINWLVNVFDRVDSAAARVASTSPAAATALPPWCLATWGGLASHTYELFATELASVQLQLPDGGRVLDLARVVGPKRLYPRGDGALVELAAIAEHVLTRRCDALSGTATGKEAAEVASSIGPIEGCRRGDPTAEPLLLSVLLHELVARGTGRVGDLPPVRGRAGYTTDLAPFLAYGTERAAWEAAAKKDAVPETWHVRSAPLEQPKGLPFRAKPGCAARGGPSAKLLAACGLSEEDRRADKTAPATDNPKGRPNAAAEDLIIKIFDFFFATPSDGEGESALQMMVSATNAKAAELVVKEARNSAFRAATDADRCDELTNDQPGQHARYRSPTLVETPVTVSEMRVFLGARFLMGARNPTKLDHCWCTSEDSEELRLPKVADSMTLDRFKAILSNLSFLKPDSTAWLDDPLFAKIRKFKVGCCHLPPHHCCSPLTPPPSRLRSRSMTSCARGARRRGTWSRTLCLMSLAFECLPGTAALLRPYCASRSNMGSRFTAWCSVAPSSCTTGSGSLERRSCTDTASPPTPPRSTRTTATRSATSCRCSTA